MADKNINVTIAEPKLSTGDIAFSYVRLNGNHSVQMHVIDSAGRPIIASWVPSATQIKAIKKGIKFCLPEFKAMMVLPDGSKFQTEAQKLAEEATLGDPGEP